jgi:hypothetical protein
LDDEKNAGAISTATTSMPQSMRNIILALRRSFRVSISRLAETGDPAI